MSNALKAVLTASAFLVGSGALAVLAVFVVAVTTGPSVAAGSRAALVAGTIDVLIAVAAVASFWMVNRSLAVMPRILSTGLFAVLECMLLALVFLFTLVLLNR